MDEGNLWHRLVHMLSGITAAVTGPPPNNYYFKTHAIGGSRSPLGYFSFAGLHLVYFLSEDFNITDTPARIRLSVSVFPATLDVPLLSKEHENG